MTINKTLQTATKKLKRAKMPSAELDAEVLLSCAVKKPKEFLFTHPEYQLNKKQEQKFNRFISCRAKGEPVAYLIGHKEFFGLDFVVNKNVLIPRPETELLVEEVINFVKKTISHKPYAIYDVGTGSGNIAIALAKNLPRAKIIATEKSAKALIMAKKNTRLNKVKIDFYRGDLLTPVKNKKIDVVVANLPYLPSKK
ncbi:MAG: HemK/PrmC family methyltransferase, partial [Patescibacteria group bacterium]